MTPRIAVGLCTVAARVLPEARREWGDAMIVELSQADDGRSALAFAGGCLAAALRERIRDVDTRFVAGLWSIAIVTALLAVERLACAARGVAVLAGARDGMHELLLVQGHSATLLTRYDAARPIVVTCFAILGCAQLAGAWYLSRGKLRQGLAAWCLALLVATLAVAVQLSIIWNPDGLPSEFHALLVQAVAVPALLAWFRTHPDRPETAA